MAEHWLKKHFTHPTRGSYVAPAPTLPRDFVPPNAALTISDTSALEALGARYTETLPVIVTEEVDREGVQE